MSILAQAQQLVTVGSLERVAGFAGNLSGVWPEARHKVNVFQMVDDFAEALGVSPTLIRSDDDAQSMVAAEQQAAQMAALNEQVNTAANTAKAASDAEVSENNALGAVMRRAGLA